MIKKSFKNKLLTTASMAVLGSLASQSAWSANVPTNAGTAGAYTLTASVDHSTGTVDNTGGTGNDTVVLTNTDNGNTLTVSGGIITSSNNKFSVTTTGDTTASIAVTGGQITNINGIDVLKIAHGFGSITVSSGNITALTTGDAIDFTGAAEVIAALTVSGSGLVTSATGSAIHVAAATTITAGLVNSSTSNGITGTGNASIGIELTDTLTSANTIGTIYNAAGATITVGGNTASVGINVGGVISNSGGGVGIYNAGTISTTAAGTALVLSAAGATTVTNAATGSITASTTGTAVDITGALTGTFTNNGWIDVAGDGAGIDVGHNTTAISNTGTIESTGATSDGKGAVAVTANTLTLLTNTGTIRDTAAGNAIQNDSTITTLNNSTGGIITSAGQTINADAAITTLNNSTATSVISSTSATASAIDFAASASRIVNVGSITSTGTAATINWAGNMTSGSTDVLNNSGTISNDISGNGSAIVAATDLQGANSDITNTGIIRTTGATNTASTILIADMDGSVYNSGTISSVSTGSASAIEWTAFTGGNLQDSAIDSDSTVEFLANSGTITSAGTDSTAKLAGNAGTNGQIVNTGVISNTGATAGTAGTALDLSGNTGANIITVVNSGTISTTSTANETILLGDVAVLTNTGTITSPSATEEAIVAPNASAETINWYGGTITGTINLGNTGDADLDTINIGDSSADSITTGGAIAGTSILHVKYGTFNIGHNLTIDSNADATADFIVDSGATANFTADNTLTVGDADVNGTLKIAAGKTITTAVAVTSAAIDFNTGSKLDIGLTKMSTPDHGKIVSTAGAADTINIVTGTKLNFTVSAAEYMAAGTLTDVISADAITIDGVALTKNLAAAAITISDDSHILSFAVASSSDGTGLDIAVTRENSLDTVSTQSNQTSVGQALEAIGTDGDDGLDAIMTALDGMSTSAQIEAALDTLTPEMGGAVTSAAMGAADAGTSTVNNRLDQLAGIDGTTGVATGGGAYRNGIWAQAFGTAADQGDRKGVRGYQSDTGGGSIGFDTSFSDNGQVGLSAAYAVTQADSANGTTDIDSYQGNIYGTYDYGKWYSEALAGFTYSSFETKRNIVVGAINNQAKGEFDGQQYTAKVGVGYKVNVPGGLNVTPVASLKYDYITLDKYTETGSTANLAVDNDDLNVLKAGVGLKLNYPIVDGSVTYIPAISAGYSYDFIGDEQETKSNFTGAAATQFTNKGAKVARNTFDVGLGLDVLAQDNLTVSFDYDWTSKEDYNAHSGAIKARFSF